MRTAHAVLPQVVLLLAMASAGAGLQAAQFSPQAAVFENDLGVSTNEPVYFILGRKSGWNARFQISLKYQPLERFQGWRHLGFTFTTTSLWDLHSSSSPFRDSTYRPGLAWTQTFPDQDLAVDLGWEHESNGRGPDPDRPMSTDDELSRSMNRFFLRGRWTFLDGQLLLAPKLVWNYNKAPQNGDIDRYRGYCDWLVKWQSKPTNGYTVSLLARQGTDSSHHFLQADLGLPFQALDRWTLFQKANGWFLCQYLYGYGLTLRDYNVLDHGTWRIGIMIVP